MRGQGERYKSIMENRAIGMEERAGNGKTQTVPTSLGSIKHTLALSHTHSQSHTHSHTHALSFTYTHILFLSHTHTFTYILSLSFSHTHTCTYVCTHTLMLFSFC